jgi:hypothetical protein
VAVPDRFDAMTDDTLLAHLYGEAAELGQQLVIEERGGEWFAETKNPSGLGGEVVPLADQAVTLPEEVVPYRATGPDRRTAMLELGRLIADQ